MELWYSLGSGSPGSALRLGSCAIFCACCLCQANVPLWNEVSTAGSVQARYDLSGVLTPSGRAYVFGGSDASTGSARKLFLLGACVKLGKVDPTCGTST